MPIAVISGASRGALRSRRYATRSTPMLSVAQKAAAQISARTSEPKSGKPLCEPSRPSKLTATV